jgi:hypothetical protein
MPMGSHPIESVWYFGFLLERYPLETTIHPVQGAGFGSTLKRITTLKMMAIFRSFASQTAFIRASRKPQRCGKLTDDCGLLQGYGMATHDCECSSRASMLPAMEFLVSCAPARSRSNWRVPA